MKSHANRHCIATVAAYEIGKKIGKKPYGAAWYVGGRRKTKWFKSRAARRKFIRQFNTQLAIGGTAWLDAPPDRMAMWHEADKLVGSIGPVELARFWLDHNPGAPRNGKPVLGAVEEFVAHLAIMGKSRAYFLQARNSLRRFANQFAAKQVHELNFSDLTAYLSLFPHPLTYQTKRAFISVFFRYSIKSGWCATNPALTVALPQWTQPEPEIISPETAGTILAEAWAIGKGFAARLAIEMFTGMRTSTARRLKWADVDLGAKTITVGAAHTKKRRRQIVEGVPPTVWTWLACCTEGQFDAAAKDYGAKKARADKAGGGIPRNAFRKSFTSYHVSGYRSAAGTALIIGHKGDTDVLYNNYYSAQSAAKAAEWFALTPEALKLA